MDYTDIPDDGIFKLIRGLFRFEIWRERRNENQITLPL